MMCMINIANHEHDKLNNDLNPSFETSKCRAKQTFTTIVLVSFRDSNRKENHRKVILWNR